MRHTIVNRPALAGMLTVCAGVCIVLTRGADKPAAPTRPPRALADLPAYEQTLRDLYRRVAPATVNLFAEPKHEHIGSGAVIEPTGLILTHGHHGLEPRTPITAVFADGKKAAGQLRGVHEPFDVSLAQLDGKGPWPALPLGEPSSLKPGDGCVMLGYPKLHHKEGRPPLFRLGRFLGTREHYLLTSANLNGGDSGGPLVGLDGKLLGNNNLVPTERQGTGHTSVDYFRMIRPLLMTGRHVRRGDLLMTGPFEDVGGLEGLAVPTHKAVFAIMDGDRRVALGLVIDADGWAVTKASELPVGKVMCKLADGKQIEATLAGRSQDHDLALLRLPAKGLTAATWAESAPQVGQLLAAVGPDPWPLALGVAASEARSVAGQPGALAFDVADGEGGVRVTGVKPFRPRTAAVIRRGDIITHLAGDATPDRAAFDKAVAKRLQGANGRPGERVPMKLMRGGKTLDVSAPVETAYATPATSEAEAWSTRHDGFPGVFLYDGVILSTHCGGPLVGTDGKVAAVVVARLGTGSHVYALPAAEVRRVFAELRRSSP